LSDEALQVLRLRALRGIELGYSELDLAALLGVCHETISRWWTAYSAEGLTALPRGRSGRPLGTGRLLSDSQAQRIKECLDHHCPEELGIPHALGYRAVRDLIRARSLASTWRNEPSAVAPLGYTSKKPSRHSQAGS
jgi:transposase